MHVTITFRFEPLTPNMEAREVGTLVADLVTRLHGRVGGDVEGKTVVAEVPEAYVHQVEQNGHFLPWVQEGRDPPVVPTTPHQCRAIPLVVKEGEDPEKHYCVRTAGHDGDHICKCDAGFHEVKGGPDYAAEQL